MPLMNPSLLLDFANARQLGPLVTFTRASSTWRTNRFGILEPVPSGAPVFDYDPITLASRGLSISESRANLLLHNRDLTNAAWVTTAGTGTETKDATGADGVANAATRLTATSADYTIIQSITSASASRAATAYVRRITGTGTIEFTANAGATWTPITITTSYTRAAAPVATITNPEIGFRINTSGDEIAVDFVQGETGAFATPPIETAGSQVTRAAEFAVISGAAFSSFWRSDRGTIVITYRNGGDLLVTRALRASDGTANNLIDIVAATGGGTGGFGFANVGGATVVASVPGVATTVANERVTAAVAYALNDYAGSRNGGAAGTDTSATVPTVSQMNIGSGVSDSWLNGWIERIAYYPERLSNADLQALSAA
jgi:hypothetical protein